MKIYGLWEKLTELIFYKKGEVRINPVDQDAAGVDADKVLTIPNIDPTPQELVLSEQAQTVSNKTFTDSSYAGSHSGTYTGTFDRHEVSSAEIAASSGSNELVIPNKTGVVRLTSLDSGKLDTITADPTVGASFILVNATGQDILIEGESGNIKAGTDQRITLVKEGAVQFLYTGGVWSVVDGTVGQLTATHVEITTTSPHGFTDSDIGTPLYLNGSVYSRAHASAANTAEVLGIIRSVIDADTFELVTSGIITDIPLTRIEGTNPEVGDVIFLSATVGKLTVDEPAVVGQISKPLGIIFEKSASSYKLFSYNMRGLILGGANVRNEILLNTASGSSTEIVDIEGSGGGLLEGWLKYTRTDTGLTYSGLVSFRFVKSGSPYTNSGYVYTLAQYVADTSWSSGTFVWDISNNKIRLTANSTVLALNSASLNFTINGAADGVTQANIDSEKINFGTIKARTADGITFVDAAGQFTTAFLSDAGDFGVVGKISTQFANGFATLSMQDNFTAVLATEQAATYLRIEANETVTVKTGANDTLAVGSSGNVSLGPANFTSMLRHTVNGQLATLYSGPISVGLTAVDVLDFTEKPRGMYLVSAVRQGGSVATNILLWLGVSDTSIVIYAVLSANALSASTSGKVLRLQATVANQIIYTNAVYMVGGV